VARAGGVRGADSTGEYIMVHPRLVPEGAAAILIDKTYEDARRTRLAATPSSSTAR
jgi:hypothetical protein